MIQLKKTLQYACRKTLADSRPRVRGRFAKNDDFGETNRAASNNHEEDDDNVRYLQPILHHFLVMSSLNLVCDPLLFCLPFFPADNSERRRRHG